MANTGIIVRFENSAGQNIEGDSKACASNTPGTNCGVDDSPISIHLADGSYPSAVVTFYHHGYVQETQSCPVNSLTYEDCHFYVSNGHPIHGSIEGYVYDTSDRPITNSMIWAIGTSGTTETCGCVTNSDGFYCLPIFEGGDYVISAGKNGYETVVYGTYGRSGNFPTATETKNFTGINALERANFNVDNSNLFTYGRTKMIIDEYDSNYSNTCIDVDVPQNDTVYAKTRKFSGLIHSTYNTGYSGECRDGYSGSDYEGGYA
jgi:hypothetical protein